MSIHTLPTIVLREKPEVHFRIHYDGDWGSQGWSVFLNGRWLCQYVTFRRAIWRLWRTLKNADA